jgi:PAS domain S-box-containing protein
VGALCGWLHGGPPLLVEARLVAMKRIKLLLVEDEISEARLIRMTLATAKNAAFDLMGANCLSAALDLLSKEQVDIVLLDLSLPDSQGVDTLRTVHSAAPEVPVVVLLDAGSDEMAKTVLSKGACDYLVRRSMTVSVLEHCILHAIERSRVAVESGHGEKYVRALIENAPVAILLLDEKGIMRYYSPSMKHILGYDEGENIGKSIFDFVHPDDLSANIEVFTKLVSQPGNTYVTELRGRHKNGSWRYVEVLGINHLQTPEVGGIVINFCDITDRRQVEAELRETERRYRAIFDNPLNIVYVIDERGVILEASDRTLRRMGFTREDVGKTSLMDLVHPEDLQRATAGALEAASMGHNEHPIEVRVFTKTGEMIWVESVAFSIEKSDQHFKNLAIARDVTERKKTEEALRESEERFRTLIENAQDGISIAEPDGTMRYVSPSTERILGFKPEELVGKNVTEFLHPDDVYNAFEPRPRLLGEPETLMSQIYRLRHKDGSWRVLEATNKNLLDDPKVRGIVSNFHDITERKEGEESLARYAAELMRSNKELEQFAFIASHDLQEPLRLMRIYVQLFAKRYQGKLDSDADEFVGYIVSSARRMQELIEGLLAYSLVVAPGREDQEIDCEATLYRALGTLRTSVEESRAVVTHDSLPHVVGDGLQLEQLFQNLIDNAIKFRSEETPRIHVSAEEKAGEWVFSVQDNGIGIDPEFAERIFVVFKRLHREEDYPGAGVGLTLCRKIVERHNGHIWVESEAGKGAKFRFTIPVSGVEHP